MWTTHQRLELASMIRETWWQSERPPEKAPEGWSLGRDLDICRTLIEREGEDASELLGMLSLYDGPPATLAVFYKKDERGLRKILNELRGLWLNRQGHKPRKPASHPDVKQRADEGSVEAGSVAAAILRGLTT